MQRHWSQVAPPLNISLAAQIGFKPKKAEPAQEQLQGDDLMDWLRGNGLMS